MSFSDAPFLRPEIVAESVGRASDPRLVLRDTTTVIVGQPVVAFADDAEHGMGNWIATPPHTIGGVTSPGNQVLYDNPDTLYRMAFISDGKSYVITDATLINDQLGALSVGAKVAINAYTDASTGQRVATQVPTLGVASVYLPMAKR